MNRPEFTRAVWAKSPESTHTNCVEVAHVPGWVGVRDTKDHGQGPLLAFTESEWKAFLGGVAGGSFDYGLRD